MQKYEEWTKSYQYWPKLFEKEPYRTFKSDQNKRTFKSENKIIEIDFSWLFWELHQ